MIDPLSHYRMVLAFYEAGLARLLIENEANLSMLRVIEQQERAQRECEIIVLERAWRMSQ